MNFRQSYREGAALGANPVELVIRLYDRLIEYLRQASLAIERKEIERRGNAIRHALLIIGCLQSALDFSQGGKVAENLDNFYNSLRSNLLSLQFRASKHAIAQQLTDVLAVRQAWIEVERKERMRDAAPPSPAPPAEPPAPAPDPYDLTASSRLEWKA